MKISVVIITLNEERIIERILKLFIHRWMRLFWWIRAVQTAPLRLPNDTVIRQQNYLLICSEPINRPQI